MSDGYRLKILLFATLKDKAGTAEVELAFAKPVTLQELKRQVGESIPAVADLLPSSIAAINQEFAFDEDVVPEGSEVAFFPPVSGGTSTESYNEPEAGAENDIYLITEDELDLDGITRRLVQPTTGAVCAFIGMVRGETTRNNPQTTAYLEYEAYQSMALAKMQQVGQEIHSNWPDIEKIAIVQRIGKLMPGTPTVLICCTAAHRDTGVFEAARYGIDRLKEIVPVWKKEIGPKDQTWVSGEYTPSRDDRY